MAKIHTIDPALIEWATDRQAEYIRAVNKHGGFRQAAKHLGIKHTGILRSINSVKAKAAMAGYSPEHNMRQTAPEPFFVDGVSTLFDGDGNVRNQWVKTKVDTERRREVLRAAYEALSDDLPRLLPIASPAHTEDSLCNFYPMTDCHVGMLAWHKEGGADWDLKIAEATLVDCFERMVTTAPKSLIGVVGQLGDFLHYDGLMPVTPTSGHILDSDGRFSKIVQAAIRILRRLIDLALQRHEIVVVLIAEGNHDLASSVWLRCMFKALYENEPRVAFVDSELPYYAFQHGETMLAFHHGHLSKKENLPLLFAASFPEMWGSTSKRYCHTGHYHSVDEREHPGMKVIQHPTIAARDAHTSRYGWISERDVTAITYHSEFGQVTRTTVTPEMVGL